IARGHSSHQRATVWIEAWPRTKPHLVAPGLAETNRVRISNSGTLAMPKRELMLFAVVLGFILCCFLMSGDTRHRARLPTAGLHHSSLKIRLYPRGPPIRDH